MRPRFLNGNEFAKVVRNTPLVAIDLIIRDPARHVLVGLRTNEPAKAKWLVPVGVVMKYERLADAFARIVEAEIGLPSAYSAWGSFLWRRFSIIVAAQALMLALGTLLWAT
jgi:colanic acid biosynthesis protein WcaH